MPKNHKKTVFIPAGMSLKGHKIQDTNTQKTLTSPNVEPSTSSGRIFSAPKTICKNKSLNIGKYNFPINENAGFSSDFKNAPGNSKDIFSTLSRPQKIDQLSPSANQNKDMSNDPVNGILKENTKTLTSCSKPEVSPEKENIRAHGKTFKEIMQEKLKKAKQDRRIGDLQRDPKDKCDCENCDNFINCAAWRSFNTSFEISNEKKHGLPLLKNKMEDVPPRIETNVDNKIILQGVMIPKEKSALDETCIDENIQIKLTEINCTSAIHVQRYMWPAVQRGLSVFMIAPPQSGKTLAYLPIFCTFCEERICRYKELAVYDGPLILILAPNVESCYEIHNVTKTIISYCSEVTVDVSTDDSAIQNCDILITTPEILEQNVKRGKVHLKRLCHLAIENAHIVLRTHSESIGNICKVINNIQANRPHHKSIQTVVTSEKWSVDLETLLKSLHIPPLVCFEDFLEAAVYSKVDFRRKNLKSSHKIFYLIDQLKGNYMITKTVVFCEDEDISKIKETLEVSGIECISISNSLSEDEMFIDEETWGSLRIGQYKVLLCTDATFEKTVHIQDAKWLIHYSLPKDWQHFQQRFRCFSKNVRSPLSAGETSHVKAMTSFMIIDEVCNNQLCLDFFDILLRNYGKYLQL